MTRHRTTRRVGWAIGMSLIWWGVSGDPASAQTVPPAGTSAAKENPASSPSEKQISEWIEQLAADRFMDRQTASKALRRAGQPAVPFLEKAARGANRERSARAVQILEAMYRKGDGALKTAAREALARIGASGASAARTAREAIADRKAENPRPNRIAGGFFVPAQRGVRIFGGGIQLPQGMGGRQVAVTRAGGVTTTTLKEKGRTAKLVEDPQKGITLEVTETKKGKPVTKKYQAKDAAALKKKDAQAYKLYQELKKHGRVPNAVQMQIIAGGGGPGGIMPPWFPGPGLPAQPAQGGAAANLPTAQVKTMLERVEKSLAKLKSVEAAGKSRQTLADSIRELEALRSELKKALSQ